MGGNFRSGRIEVVHDPLAVNTQGGSTSLLFYLFSPEKLGGAILPGPAGPEILVDTEPFRLPLPPELVAKATRE